MTSFASVFAALLAAEILALPVRNSKEDCNDESRDQLQVVGVQAEVEDHLNNQIVDNRTKRYAEQTHRKVAENTAEQHLADDDSGKADNDSAAAGVDIRKALILAVQRTCQRNQAVGQHQTEHLDKINVDALRAAHVRVCAGRTDGAAERGTEEPVQQCDNHNRKDSRNENRVLNSHLLNVAQRNKQLVVVRIDRYICFFVHNAQVNGEQRQLCQNTGQNRRNTPYRYAEYR